jgi:hypothetical protein
MFLDRPKVNGIRRLCRAVAGRPSAPGRAGPPTGRAKICQPHPARRPGRDGFAGRFIQDVAAAVNVATGQNWPAPTAATSRRRTMTAPGPLPHTGQLCTHCRQRPAGFWVSDSGQTVRRRPWCLSCCQDLNPSRCHVIPFDD